MNETLTKKDGFYSEHPKAKRAFQKTKDYYQEKIDAVEIFFKELQDKTK